ncbi:MAG: HAMP domain-containing histidine kinase [Alphaproteobacteria bacterium]|nr:HAMP domain-containing histidine kinase [Alphaproteobacteria bacterium]
MLRLLHVSAWPLAVKVPVLAAGLMITVATTVSYVVLWRFVQDQESNLELLASTYLDGVSATILPAIIREDVWEVYDALDRARRRYAGVEPRFTIVALPNGRVLAASDPRRFPFQSIVPEELRKRFPADDGFIIDTGAGQAWLARTLQTGGFSVGRLFAGLDVTHLLRLRREILLTLILVNGGLTLTFALGGYFALKRMVQPVAVLTRYVEKIRDGRMEPIPRGHRNKIASEFGELFDRFNAMARALRERQALAARLTEQEKYAMLGRLASGMAHEVNNPLGGMLNAIDTIQAYGNDPAVLQTSLDFLRRGLANIRNVARAALVTYKGGSDTDFLTEGDLDDIPFLVQHETGARRLHLDWRNRISRPLAISGSAVRQITLNLLLNACAASPIGGLVTGIAWCSDRVLQIVVADEGPGLPKDTAALLNRAASETAPSQESKGLGLWIIRHLIHRLGGRAEVEYPGVGTRVVVTLPVLKEIPDVAA